MSKAVLISIRPEWCDLIVRGEKTIEVRKTRPRQETPFKAYIYCAKAPQQLITIFKDGEETMDGEIHHGKSVFVKFDRVLPDGIRGKTQMVIGEFICDEITPICHAGTMGSNELPKLHTVGSKLEYRPIAGLLQKACLSEESVERYLRGSDGFGWHITKLKIYDAPKLIRSFLCHCAKRYAGADGKWHCKSADKLKNKGSGFENEGCICTDLDRLNRPPQSWCYVQEMEVADGKA